MGLTFVRRLLIRFPGLRWALSATLQRVPALDRRLRSAVAALEARPLPLRIDATHLPEDALPVYRALAEAIARQSDG
jgi:hypothetical protein